MVLSTNPFNILGVSSRDSRSRLELVVESAQPEHEAAWREAKSLLLHPRRRIKAEVRWLPGVAPARARELASLIPNLSELVPKMKGLNRLALANLGAEILLIHDTPSMLQTHKWLVYAGQMAESLDIDNLAATINEDRAVAGIPLIGDEHHVEDELVERQKEIVAALHEKWSSQSEYSRVVRLSLEQLADEKAELPSMLDELCSRFELQAQARVGAEAAQVRRRLESIKNTAARVDDESRLAPLVGKLITSIEGWDKEAQPLQRWKELKGLQEESSADLVREIRSTAIDLNNDYGYHASALRITETLRTAAAELIHVSDLLEQDHGTLANLVNQRTNERQEEEKKRKAASVQVELGSDRVTVGPIDLVYKRDVLRLEDINGLRWGVYKQYVNGIRASRSFQIAAGTPNGKVVIECVRFMDSETVVGQRYQQIVNALWNLVGTRIVEGWFSELRAGSEVSVGGIRICKDGMWLNRQKWFSKSPELVPWSQLRHSTSNGHLAIVSTSQKHVSGTLSLRDDWNACVLDNFLDFVLDGQRYQSLFTD